MPIDIGQPALEVATEWTRNFPKPPNGHGVRADALLAAYRRLEPLADEIVKLPVGAKKGSYPGAGYLTGKLITEDDINTARAVKLFITTALPAYGKNPVEPQMLRVLKERGQRLLMIATDIHTTFGTLEKLTGFWNAIDLNGAFMLLVPIANLLDPEVRKLAGDAAGHMLEGLIKAAVVVGGIAVGVFVISNVARR